MQLKNILHILSIIIISINHLLSQIQNKDSLIIKLKKTNNDTNTVLLCSNLAAYYLNIANFNKTDSFTELIKPLSERLNYNKGKILYLINKSRVAEANGDYAKATELNYEIIKKSEEYNYPNYKSLGYTNLGILFFTQKQYDKALECYFKSIEYAKKINKVIAIANNYNNIGNVYFEQLNFKDALKYYTLSLEERRKINDKAGIANSLNNIGNIYLTELNYIKSLEYFNEAEILQIEIQDNFNLAYSYLNKAFVFVELNKKTEAKHNLDLGNKLATEINSLDLNRDLQSISWKYHEKFKEHKEALEAYKNYISLRDSMKNLNQLEEITRKEIQFEYSKKELQNKMEMENQEILFEQQSMRQKIFLSFVVIILIIIIIFSYFLLKRYRITREQNNIIEAQKDEVELKNKEIKDSINYASSIQQSLLPPKELKYKLFPNAFVLFQPKDIVSGDFYWFGEKNGKRIIAAVDCTGHGVPGSLMSMIGNNFLNELIEQKGITKPAELLNELKFKIINALKQSETTHSRDGMDAALLTFNADNSKVEFAGANNPLWIIRNNELIEYNGDKQPVGFYVQPHKSFSNHTIDLVKGDTLYIFTDGYSDQFGGPKGKKFKYATLKSLLISISNKPVEEQEQLLINSFNSWKGELEQVDDVLLIGIKI